MNHSDIKTVLEATERHEAQAADQLFPLVYDRLRAIAGAYFRGQSQAHTLQPTALVHEAFMQIAKRDEVSWQGRAHFLAVAAVAMRGILVDHARRRGALKRGGDRQRVTLFEPASGDSPIDALAIDEVMSQLAERHARQARVAELRFFGGMTVAEVAHVLETSNSTVEEDWRFARAWLSTRLRDQD